MNKQGPNKIDWTDYTWNPISGCKHGCDYCYMRRMEPRFKDIMDPRFHEGRLDQPLGLKKPSKIFVGSSGDMWGDWVPKPIINTVLDVCRTAPQHTFQFLTKNPHKYGMFHLPKNGWYGTTVDGTARTEDNLEDLKIYTNAYCRITRFVSFEPLLGPVDVDLSLISWVIIGADSNRGATKPPKEWAQNIIKQARGLSIPVFIKNNYWHAGLTKEFPDG